MPITPLFAAVFALMYVVLAVLVIHQRLNKKVVLGSGEDRELERAIRVHGNFAEYVPFTLLLLWFLESITFNSGLALILGCVLLVGRIAHVIGIRDPENYMILRQVGMLATFSVMGCCSAFLIWHYLPF